MTKAFREFSVRFVQVCVVLSLFSVTAAGAEGPIRVALVGLVHGHAKGFLRALPGNDSATLVAIVEPREDLTKEYASRFGLDPKLFYTDLERMLTEQHPDAVLVYTAIADHRKVIEAAAQHGVSSMVEKPLATTLEDALAIRAIARKQHVQVLVNYETTWYASNREVFVEAEQGKLGEIRKVVVHDGHEGPKEIGVEPEFLSWLTDPVKNGAGAMFDFGCYGADLMTVLMHGEAPVSVTAVAQTDKPDIYPKVDDDATLILRYAKAQGVLMPSWNWSFSRKDMEVYGTGGYAITVGSDRLRVRYRGQDAESQAAAAPLEKAQGSSLSYLSAVLRGQIKPEGDLSSLETNMVVVQILDAGRRSAQTGRTVTIEALPK
ncbi:MAG TPA: Gfo/Idh/MocA family oxidoreductase [Candidatus Saccharimonadales bacterium]|nr:Gfo/Idh/MocA family oxidoreductase [Candidatus Saccharimonadales bacterium]